MGGENISQCFKDKKVGPKIETQEKIPNYFYSWYGLAAMKVPFDTQGLENETISKEKIIPEDNNCTLVHFLPEERLTSDPKFRTESLFYSVEGLKEMIEAIDNNKVDLPPTFIGFTNVDMAKIAIRFGFKVVDSCLDNNGTQSQK